MYPTSLFRWNAQSGIHFNHSIVLLEYISIKILLPLESVIFGLKIQKKKWTPTKGSHASSTKDPNISLINSRIDKPWPITVRWWLKLKMNAYKEKQLSIKQAKITIFLNYILLFAEIDVGFSCLILIKSVLGNFVQKTFVITVFVTWNVFCRRFIINFIRYTNKSIS